MWLWVIAGIIIVIGFVAFTGAPYVPSKPKEVARAFAELYPLSAADTLVDIGSGDGVVLRAASRCGAQAVGYELHPLLVGVSRLLSRGDKNVQVRLANFWRTSLPDATTVVYTFGDARDIGKMYGRVADEAARLKKQLVFISYAFEIPGVAPAKTVGAHHLYYIKPLREGAEHV